MKTTATGKSENILNDCPARQLHFIDAELFFLSIVISIDLPLPANHF